MGSGSEFPGGQDLFELIPLAYEELRRLARQRMARMRPGASITPTELVNEVLLRLIQETNPDYNGQQHLLRVASLAMHNVLVDRVRKRLSAKRGGLIKHVELDDDLPIAAPVDDMLSFHEACEALRAHSEAHFELVLLRVYAGLSIDEIAAQRGQSTRTVERQWRLAKALLTAQMDISRQRLVPLPPESQISTTHGNPV